MSPIDPAELSALLDGELTPSRADEVRAALEHDPALKAEFEQLRQFDDTCRQAASTASFQPLVTIGVQPDAWSWAVPVMLGGAILTVRFLPKMWDLAMLGPLLHIVVLAIVLWWIVRLASRDAPLLPLGPESVPGRPC